MSFVSNILNSFFSLFMSLRVIFYMKSPISIKFDVLHLFFCIGLCVIVPIQREGCNFISDFHALRIPDHPSHSQWQWSFPSDDVCLKGCPSGWSFTENNMWVINTSTGLTYILFIVFIYGFVDILRFLHFFKEIGGAGACFRCFLIHKLLLKLFINKFSIKTFFKTLWMIRTHDIFTEISFMWFSLVHLVFMLGIVYSLFNWTLNVILKLFFSFYPLLIFLFTVYV